MAKQILIYSDIYSYTAAAFINALEEAGAQDLEIRVNTSGGEPEYAWGMLAKLSEMTGKKMVKVDGKAHSMGAFFLCYADDSECLDVSQAIIHRAAYPQWIESNEKIFTPTMKANLANVNGNLRKALEATIDVEKLEKLKGITIDQIFSMDARNEVVLNAQEMKKVGLVKRVVAITPKKKAEIEALVREQESEYRIAAEVTEPKESKISTMKIENVKAENPAVYNEIFQLGVKQERDRVAAWMAFQKIDAEAVTKGIVTGTEVNSQVLAEMTVKALSTDGLKKIAAEATPAVTTAEAQAKAKTEKEKQLEEFEKSVKAELKTL